MVAAIAVLSMLVGSFLAVVQNDFRRLLAYSGVAHAGFILTGVVAGESALVRSGSTWRCTRCNWSVPTRSWPP